MALEPLHPPEKTPGSKGPNANGKRKTTIRPVRRRPARPPADDSGSKWLIYFLIFGVGNVILFVSTGYVVIPK